MKSIVAAIVLALVAVPVCADEILDRVLAVVAGDVILQSDVTAARDFGFASGGDAADPTAAILAQLVDRALVLAEVDRYAPPEPTPNAIDVSLAAVRARFPSDAAYRAALGRSGLDGRRLRQLVRQNLRIESYLRERFRVPPPTDDEIARYYREHASTFQRGGVLRALDDVRPEVSAAWAADRRGALVADWVAGLRRRAEIIDLYLPAQPGGR